MGELSGVSEEAVKRQLSVAKAAGRSCTVVLLPGAGPFLKRQVEVWVGEWGGRIVFEEDRGIVSW